MIYFTKVVCLYFFKLNIFMCELFNNDIYFTKVVCMYFFKLNIFMCELFNNDISNLYYIAPNNKMISELERV